MNTFYFLYRSSQCLLMFLLVVTAGCQLKETEFIQPVPIALEASDVTSTSFVASWKPVLGSTIYLVDVATDLAFTYPVKGYQSLEVVGTSLQITNLEAQQAYYYRVRAKKGNVISINSNVITVNSALLTAPVALTASNKKVLQFTANWSSTEGASSYLVDVALDSTFTTIFPGYNGKETVDTTLTIAGLDYKQTYYYRVKAKRLEKRSAYSNTSQVRPVISPTCKLTKIAVPAYSVELNASYDEQGRLAGVAILSNGAPYITYTIQYDAHDNPTEVVYNYSAFGVQEKYERIYTQQGLVKTLIVYSGQSAAIKYVTDYMYNAKNQLIASRKYSDADRTTLADSATYELDPKGNVIKSEVANIENGNRSLSDLQYDAEFNPLLLIRPELRSYMSVLSRPVELQLNNPIITATKNYYTYDGSEYTYEENSVSYYRFNEQGVLTKEAGTYNVTYEYTGCDF